MNGYDFVGFGNQDEDEKNKKPTIPAAVAYSEEGSKAIEKAGLGKGADKKAARKATAGKIVKGAEIANKVIEIAKQVNKNPIYENWKADTNTALLSEGGSKESSQRTSTTKDDEFKNTSPLADANIDYLKKKKQYGLA